jgi:hypothetical protein
MAGSPATAVAVARASNGRSIRNPGRPCRREPRDGFWTHALEHSSQGGMLPRPSANRANFRAQCLYAARRVASQLQDSRDG